MRPLVGRLRNGVDLDIGELEVGELGEVGLAVAAELLGDTIKLVLNLALDFGAGVHQFAAAVECKFISC